MITTTGYAGLGSSRRTGRGLGAMPALSAQHWQSLTPWQQQAYLNNDPNYMSAGGPAPPAPPPATSLIPAATQATVANPQFSTQQNIGAQPTTTFTLDSYMAQWAAGSIAFPSALQGTDPMAQALAVAQSYCAAEGVSDCNNLNAIASKYGQQVKAAAVANVAAGSASPVAQPGTTSPTHPIRVRQSASDLAPARSYAPVVVNPSPPTLPTTTGSSVASPASVASVANGTSLQTSASGCFDANGNAVACPSDIIAGIPNAVLLIGGAGLAVLLIMAGGK